LSPTRVKLTVEVPFEELEPSLKNAYKRIAAQVTVPGFRKGKVPAAIIDQRFGRGAVLDEAINEVLPKAYDDEVAAHSDVGPGGPRQDLVCGGPADRHSAPDGRKSRPGQGRVDLGPEVRECFVVHVAVRPYLDGDGCVLGADIPVGHVIRSL